MFQPASADC